jgi:hypothetical protein
MSDNRTACPKCGYLCTGKLPDTHSHVEKEETQELSESMRGFFHDCNLWRDIYFDFNDGEGWLSFTKRMNKKYHITRK